MENNYFEKLSLEQQKREVRKEALWDVTDAFDLAIYLGFPGHRGRGAHRTFEKANSKFVRVDADLNVTVKYDKLICSEGLLVMPQISSVYNAEAHSIRLTQAAQVNIPQASDSDNIYVLLYEQRLNEVHIRHIGCRGEEAVNEGILPMSWTRDAIYVYAFALNAQRTQASPTLHVNLL